MTLWHRLLCLVCCLAGVLGASATTLGAGDVVISQVWGGSTATQGATSVVPKADFIELFNRTAAPVSLNGWSINVDTPTGTSWTKHDLPNVSIPAYSYFLIRVSDNSANGVDIPTPDTVFSTTTFTELTTTGKVALRNTTAVIGATNCPTTNIVDLVTYGTSGTCREGSANAPGMSTTGSGTVIFRRGNGCVDEDQNGTDFTTGTPTPRNSASTPSGGCIIGACCDNNGTGACVHETSANCAAAGYTYISDGAACSPSPCAATGACCSGSTGSTCTAPLTVSGCIALTNGVHLGTGTTCTATPCATRACCLPDGSCCNFAVPYCTSAFQNGTAATTSVTCTAAGNCISNPANDLCANAITLSAGTPVTGNNWASTFLGDGPTSPCLATNAQGSKGVWFKFTPMATSIYELSTCGTLFDCELTVFIVPNCSNPGMWSAVGCDDDLCPTQPTSGSFCGTTGSSTGSLISGLKLNMGQLYYIRLNLAGTTATGGGNYTLVITDQGATATGACCYAVNGRCEIRTASSCTGAAPVGTYQGDDTVCSPMPCTGVYGACCGTGGACSTRLASACTAANAYQGDNTTCFPNPCSSGACCSSAGACTVTAPTGCTSSTSAYLGDDTVCTPDPCPKGACCSSTTGACTITAPSTAPFGGCASGTFQGVGTVCTAGSNPCVPANDECGAAIALALDTVASGSQFGATQSASASLCSSGIDVFYKFTPTVTGTYRILLTPTGTTSVSLSVGTICPAFDDNIFCIASSTAPRTSGPLVLTAATVYYIRAGISTTASGTAGFDLVVNTTGSGACCTNSAGVCSIVASIDGCPTTATYFGDGSTCSPDPCPKGACCNSTSGVCTITAPATQGGCTTGTYQGNNSVCDPTPCPPNGACCNPCTLACTLNVEPTCPSGSVWHVGVACTPSNLCRTFGATPANDLACNAIALTLDTPISASLAGATDTGDGGIVTDCGTTGTPGPSIWYSFQPAVTGYHTLDTCGATFDTTMAVLSGDCADVNSMTVVACDDDSCNGGSAEPVVCGTSSSSSLAARITFVWLESTVPYRIRVRALSSTTVGGSFPIRISTTSAGACCTTAGACSTTLQADCTGTSLFLGNATVCGTNPCPASGACCNNCTFACAVGFEANCPTASSTWISGGTCGTPTACVQGAPPANDLPTGAITLASNAALSGTLFTATSTDDGPASTCDAAATRGVWYKFTPGAGQGGDYSIGTCGSTFANVVTVLTGDPNNPAGMTIIACDDDACVGGIGGEPVVCGPGTSSATAALIAVAPLVAETTYYIRVQVDGTGTGAGTFSVSVRPAVSGACCANGGVCSVTITDQCTGASLFFTGQTCTSDPCMNVGACCNTSTFACALTLAAGCSGPATSFQGSGTSCAPANPCVTNDECPGPNLALATVFSSTTTGATPGAGTSPSCSISGCEDTWWDFTAPFTDTFLFHAVQLVNGEPVISLYPDCSLTGELDCLSGGRLSPVTPDITLPYAMTAGQQIKVRISSYACIDGPYTLEVNSTLPSGACCAGTACSVQLASVCTVGYRGNNSLCSPNPCAMSGACCSASTGVCTISSTAQAGCPVNTTYQGDNTVCLPNPCPQPPSVCCRGSTCNTTITQANCVGSGAAGAHFVQPAPTCNTAGNSVSPCCHADYNKVGGPTVADIFAFLTDWFAGSRNAAVGGDGDPAGPAPTVSHIFQFLTAWFAGGC